MIPALKHLQHLWLMYFLIKQNDTSCRTKQWVIYIKIQVALLLKNALSMT